MAEEKKEPWLNYLALTTIIFAVAATLSTFKGGGFSTRSVLSQEQASNKWAQYQSKSIKSYLYETQKDMLELQLLKFDNRDSELKNAYKKKIDDYQNSILKYDDDKKEIKEEAIGYEAVRDQAQLHSKTFGMAVIFLQISILLSSIAALVKKKYIWLLGVIIGAVGVFYFVDGFFLFF